MAGFASWIVRGRRDGRCPRPISTVLCEDITAVYAFSDGVGHHQVTYDFVFGPADEPFFWYSEFIDKGPRYKTSSVATATSWSCTAARIPGSASSTARL